MTTQHSKVMYETTRDIAGALWGGCKQVIAGVYNKVYKPLTPPRPNKRPPAPDTLQNPTKRLKLTPNEEPPQITLGYYIEAAGSGICKEAHQTGSSSVQEDAKAPPLGRVPSLNKISHLERVIEVDFEVKGKGAGKRKAEEGVRKIELTGSADQQEYSVEVKSSKKKGEDEKKGIRMGKQKGGDEKKGVRMAKQTVRRSRRLSGQAEVRC